MAAPSSLNQLLAKATAHLDARQWDKAERILRKALKQSPNDPAILQRLGAVQRRLGHPRKAIDLLNKALASEPGNTQLITELIESFVDLGRHGDALRHVDQAILEDPDSTELLVLRSRLHLNSGDVQQACDDCRRAHELKPDDLMLHGRYAESLIALGQPPVPTKPAMQLVQLQPFESRNHSRLGTTHRLNDELDEALDAYRRALELDARNHEALAGMAETLESMGRSKEAIDTLASHIRSPDASYLMINAWMRSQSRLEDWDASIDAATNWLTSAKRQPRHAAIVNHRLGNAFERAGRHQEAFEAWQRGNEMYHDRWNADEHDQLSLDIAEHFSTDAMQTLPCSSCDDERPLFIMGMFRSGTTLIEQVLAMHPDIFPRGELFELISIAGDLSAAIGTDVPYPKCIDQATPEVLDEMAARFIATLEEGAGDARIITDKLPLNFLNIGLISRLLPSARIIHCNRDPLDTCISCFGNSFSARMSFTANLEHLGRTYLAYHRLMEHWRRTCPLPILEIEYEQLVADPEPQIRRMLDFASLPWDPACLEFHRSRRIAQTLSMDQVRQPMHTRSIHRSRAYWDQLAPLRSVLGPLAPDAADS